MLLAIFSVLFIVACTQTEISQENVAGEVVKEIDSCSNVSCSENQGCINGTCFCNEGLKKCGEKCITNMQCCTDSNCGKNEICKNNGCIFSCQNVLCPYNQACDEDSRKCVCRQGAVFCNYQQKCLKIETCCDNYDCEANKKCTITTFSVNICFEGDQKICKYIGENSFTSFELYGNRYKFALEKIYANNEIKYSFDDSELRILKLGQRIKLAPRLYLYFQEIKEIGGVCKY